VRYTSFHTTIGTIKIGMPMYDAMKSDVDQFPLRKTGNPTTSVMMADPMNPTHAAYGWNGPFHGRLSRLRPCARNAPWKRMYAKQSVAHAINPATVLRFRSHVNACAAPPLPSPATRWC
jgi:hypothetical protein